MADEGQASEVASTPDLSSGASGATPFDRLRLSFKGIRSALAAAPSTDAGEGDAEAGASEVPDSTGGGSSASAKAPGWGSVFDRARRMVAETVAYDAVPQDPAAAAEKSEGDSEDPEKGEGPPQWVGWAKAAAGRVRHQVAKAAEETQQGISKAAEKAKSVEWGEQAKLVQTEVAKGLGRVADGATQASSKISEKGKAAQQIAKDLQEKSAQNLDKAKAAGAAKAAKVKEKATAAAGAAKGSIAKAGQNISGIAALSLSPAKLAQFGGVFFLGTFLISMSFSFLPMLVISPQKFALLFAFGSVTLLSSFAILKGPKAFAASLVQRKKLPFSSAYVIGLIGTLVATIGLRSFILTAVFGLLQAIALLYFLASYVPGGKTILNGCGSCCKKTARTVCRRMI